MLLFFFSFLARLEAGITSSSTVSGTRFSFSLSLSRFGTIFFIIDWEFHDGQWYLWGSAFFPFLFWLPTVRRALEVQAFILHARNVFVSFFSYFLCLHSQVGSKVLAL